MKKIFSIVMAMMMLFTVAAQAEVVPEKVITKPGIWDNNYVSLTVGATTPMKINRHHLYVYPQVNVYAGHNFTPVWGIEFNGEMNMWDSFKVRNCFVSSSYVGVAGTVNLNNLFAGYNGSPRFCEVIPFVGLGWLHGYVNGDGDTNDLATKMGINVQLNFNDNWAMNFRPTVVYNITPANRTYFNINHGRLGLEVGVTYSFDKRFKQKEMVNWCCYQALNDEVNKLRARQPEQVVITNTETVYVEKPVVDVLSQPTNVGFTINSDKIAYTQMAGILNVANAMKANDKLTAVVSGYADAGTGTPQYNMALSERRAEAVKNALVELGVDASRIEVRPEGSCSQIYGENDWNRAAVITLK